MVGMILMQTFSFGRIYQKKKKTISKKCNRLVSARNFIVYAANIQAKNFQHDSQSINFDWIEISY